MNIGIDISQSAYKGSGVGRYTTKLVQALCELDQDNTYTFFYSSLRQPLDRALEDVIVTNNHKVNEIVIPPMLLNLLWNDLHKLPIEVFVGNVDVFISSDWTQPPTKHARSITIVHDMIAYKWPDLLTGKTELSMRNGGLSPNIVATQKKRMIRVKEVCDHIIADSHHTKGDIQEYINVPPEKISVVYPYVEIEKPSDHNIIAVLEKFNIHRPYILSVGKLEPRKNIPQLIKAFEGSNISDAQLVIVGASGWGNIDHNEITHENVSFLGFISDEDLYCLYSGAEFFIYPSLYEGFGYPIIEAMTLGCPAATSNVASLQEVAGDSAFLFDPQDVSSISNAIKIMHNTPQLRHELAQKGLTRATHFTKESFVHNLLSVLSA